MKRIQDKLNRCIRGLVKKLQGFIERLDSQYVSIDDIRIGMSEDVHKRAASAILQVLRDEGLIYSGEREAHVAELKAIDKKKRADSASRDLRRRAEMKRLKLAASDEVLARLADRKTADGVNFALSQWDSGKTAGELDARNGGR
jgi:hypothetical protein